MNNRPSSTSTNNKNKHQSQRDHAPSKTDAKDAYSSSKPTSVKNTSSRDFQNVVDTNTASKDPYQAADDWSSIAPMATAFPTDQWLCALYHKLDENSISALEFLTQLEKNASSTILGDIKTNNNNNAHDNSSDDDDEWSLSSDHYFILGVETAFQKENLQEKQAQQEQNAISNNSANTIPTAPLRDEYDFIPSSNTWAHPFNPIADFSPEDIWVETELLLTLLLTRGLLLLVSFLERLVVYASPNNEDINNNDGRDDNDWNLSSYQGLGQGNAASPYIWVTMPPAISGIDNIQPQTYDERIHWQGTQQIHHAWIAHQNINKQHRALHLLLQQFNTSWDMWAYWIGIAPHKNGRPFLLTLHSHPITGILDSG